MSIKCKEHTEAQVRHMQAHKAIKLARWRQRRERSLTSMGWRYHL